MAPSSSTVARWELARRLGARRKAIGIDHRTIASRLDFSRNYWSAVENERTLLSREKLDDAIELLEFDEEAANELRELGDCARSRGWWNAYAERFDDLSLRLIGLEHGANSVRAYESMSVPGLLQTADYARSLIELDPFFSKVGVDDAVAVRVQRQARLQDDDPIELSAIVSEAAIVQRWSDERTHSEQLDHLLQMTLRDNIQLRILTFDTPPGIIANSSTLVFFSFESRYLPAVAFQEPVRVLDPIYEGSPEFRRLELCWNEAKRRALAPDESRRHIAAVLDGIQGA